MPPCIGTHEVFSFPPKSLLATDLVDVDDVDLRCGALSLSLTRPTSTFMAVPTSTWSQKDEGCLDFWPHTVQLAWTSFFVTSGI